MAPRGRRPQDEDTQAFHELGVRGRKTGVSIPSRTVVDEHGFQPLDSIFSSPQKQPASPIADDSGSEDMEIASSAGPGPRTLLKEQRHIQYPIPRSRSPMKTNLRSPARRNPHLDRLSSPTRTSLSEERDVTVTRRLDFAAKPSRMRSNGSGKANGFHSALVEESDAEDDDQEDDMQMPDGEEFEEHEIPDDPPEVSEDEEEVPVVASAKNARKGRQASAVALSSDNRPSTAESGDEGGDDPPPKPARGRKPGSQVQKQKVAPIRGPRKRPSTSAQDDDHDGPADEEPQRQVKKPRTTKETVKKSPGRPPKARGRPPSMAPKITASSQSAELKAKPKLTGKGRGRPPKNRALDDEAAGETSLLAIQKGPPMPKRRGLVSVHHDPNAVHQTRSGRHSFRPLGWWKGEQVITEDEERNDMFTSDRGFVLGSIKEIVRVEEEVVPPSRRAPRSKARAKAKAAKASGRQPALAAVAEDEELEQWEKEEGTVDGDVIIWEPEHEQHPPADDDLVQVETRQVAVSADAVQMKPIKDATFLFAKTLTTPFMNAGIVDLPPGAEKRPKNSRKMHLVFFVHYGKVAVTVNEVDFRISAGGQWFVPRGNYYSILNDYDTPARIFFAQAYEVAPAEVAPVEDVSGAGGDVSEEDASVDGDLSEAPEPTFI